jgi:hypothetical protein
LIYKPGPTTPQNLNEMTTYTFTNNNNDSEWSVTYNACDSIIAAECNGQDLRLTEKRERFLNDYIVDNRIEPNEPVDDFEDFTNS